MTTKENIYNNLGQINISDTKIDRTTGYVNVEDLKISNVCIICGNDVGNTISMVCDECKEAIEWAKKCMKTSKEETIEDEPEEGTIDEMTYEQALDIILSQVDLVESEENIMCKDALEEAVERLRKYERDYANELVDEFMAKTITTN